MPLKLNQIPGFADLPDSVLAAEQVAYAIHAGRISQNGEFGMVRLEIFVGLYHAGDTVILPTSKVDGNEYRRDELLYFWDVRDSGNPNTSWISGPHSLSNSLWYTNWAVQQYDPTQAANSEFNKNAGLVFTEEWYRRSGPDTQSQSSKDGTLIVFTIAQRLLRQLVLAEQPVYAAVDETTIGGDEADTELLLQTLNRNAKYAIVNTEAFYMGEFTDGQTVPTPTSNSGPNPYAYSYGECKFMACLRWTASSGVYKPPPEQLGQLGPIDWSLDQATGKVAITVNFRDDDGNLQVHHDYGRVMVIAFCTRGGGVGGGIAGSTVIRPTVLLNGWGPNAHVGSYEGGVDQGFSFGLDGSTTDPYNNPEQAFDGDDTTAATAIYQHTHAYAGLVLRFTGIPATGVSTLLIDSSIPPNGQDGQLITKRSAGIWYTVDGGSNWPEIYNSPIWPRQPSSVTLPPGTTQVDVLFFTDSHDDMIHRIWDAQVVNVPAVLGGGSSSFGARSFSEIDDAFFAPGHSLRFSTLLAMKRNIDQAVLTPEFFGPADYKDGDVIPLPVSPVDGYQYSREELVYVRSWSLVGNGFAQRVPVFFGKIDDSGLVTLHVFRLPPGGPYIDTRTSGQLTVLTVGFRQAQTPEIIDHVANNPPDDSGTAPPPDALFGSASDLTVDITAPSGAEDGFTIAHSLGETPAFVKLEMLSGGNIWLDGTAYDSTLLYLKGSAAGVVAKAFLFKTAPAAEITATPIADGNFLVPHSLGAVPKLALVQMRSGGNIWSQPAVADASFVYLTASDADAAAHVGLWLALNGDASPSVNRVQIPLSATADGNFQVQHNLGVMPKNVFLHMKSPGFPAFWFQDGVSGAPDGFDDVNLYLVSPGPGVSGYAEILF